MTKANPTPGDKAMLMFQCPWCGALPLVWCARSAGNPAFYLHSARFYLTQDRNGRLPSS